jgi:hypothetical protein
MSYIVVTAGSQQGIIDVVNERIGQGWVPHGGVCVESLIYHDKKEMSYHQAMTKVQTPAADAGATAS